MVRCDHRFSLVSIPSSLHFPSRNSFSMRSCSILPSSRADFLSKFTAASLLAFLRSKISLFLLPSADSRRGNVVIFGDLLNRLLVRHRIPGDAGFELGTQVPSFSSTHLVLFQGCRPLKDQLNSSTSFWLRFLGPLEISISLFFPKSYKISDSTTFST